MPTASLAPLDETIAIAELTRDPYPIFQTDPSLEPHLAPSLQVPLHWAWCVGHVLLYPCQ
jgi:hypothetical protein